MIKYIAGTYLGGVFIIVFVAILMLLSSLELQNAALDLKAQNGTPVTLGSIKNDVAALDGITNSVNQRVKDGQLLEGQLTVVHSASSTAFDALGSDERKILSLARDFAEKEPGISRSIVFPPRPTPDDMDPGTLEARLDKYLAGVEQNGTQSPFSKGEEADLMKATLALRTDARPVLSDYEKEYQLWTVASNSVTALTHKLETLRSAVTPLPVTLRDANYKSLVEDFQENEWLFGFLVFIPHTMLVLLLALFMGMLGSLIFLARDLAQNGAVRGMGEMSFRIGLGAAVALALFCFASAGVLALSTSEHSTTNMSPYLISFLGITAGYLSDRVTAWMRQVGENTFKLDEEKCPDRWAIGLSQQIGSQQIDKNILSKTIGRSVNDIDSWSALSSAVPCDAQSALAFYLRVHPSLLFTDIAPEVS